MSDLGSTASPPPSVPSSEGAPRRSGWLAAAISVSLSGACLIAVVSFLLKWSNHAAALPLSLHLENLSYLFVSYFGLAILVTLPVCLLGALIGRLLNRPSLRERPTPLAWAAFVVGLLAVLGWAVAYLTSTLIPDGATGVLLTVGVGLILLVPIAWIFLTLGRRTIGQLLAYPMRWLAYAGAGLLALSLLVTSLQRLRPIDVDDNWLPAASSEGTSRERPNIVLIVFDALRVDRLGCYGYDEPTSPHIDAFASDAVLFEKAVSSGAWTVPSHASLFTGLAPRQHGARFGLDRLWLDDGFLTLAEILRDSGYETMALSNNPIVSPLTNLTQGFDRVAIPRDMMASVGLPMLPFYVRALGRIGPVASVLGRWFIEDPGGRATNHIASQWIAQRDRSRPFFLFINYMETHDPYQPPQAYRRDFVSDTDISRSYWSGLNDDTLRWPYALAGVDHFSKRDLDIFSALYDARVREADDRLAELVSELAGHVDLDNTIFVLTSDHGENLGEHGLIGHQFSIHNTVIMMPLIVRWPNVLRPQRVTQLVQPYDLFPSLLAWAGAPVKQTTDVLAQPLALALKPTTKPTERLAVSEYLFWTASELEMVKRLVPDFDPEPWRTAYRAAVTDQWKLVAHLRRSQNRLELYNWARDPREERDLASIRPTQRLRLASQLAEWQKHVAPFDPNRFDAPPDPGLEKEQFRRLRDLGYAH